MLTTSGLSGIGNVLIRYNDRWRGPCYLTDSLTFTTNKAQAARFYLLKSSDTMILNGDRVSLNHGNRTITINEQKKVILRDRELINREISTFIITNGLNNTEPISYDVPLFILNIPSRSTLLNESENSSNNTEREQGFCYCSSGLYSPATINIATIDGEFIHTFTFYLERSDDSITNRVAISNTKKYDESYRNGMIIVLLLIILILTMIVSK